MVFQRITDIEAEVMCLIPFPDCSQYLIKFRVVCLYIMCITMHGWIMLLLMKRDSVADRYKHTSFNVSTDKALFKVRNRLILFVR